MNLTSNYPTLRTSGILDPVSLVKAYARHHPEIPVFPEPPPHVVRPPHNKKVLTGQCPPKPEGLHAIPVDAAFPRSFEVPN